MTTGRINQIALGACERRAAAAQRPAASVSFCGGRNVERNKTFLRCSFQLRQTVAPLVLSLQILEGKRDLHVRSQSAASLRGQTVQDRRGVVTVKRL